jgi:hypothetical protein
MEYTFLGELERVPSWQEYNELDWQILCIVETLSVTKGKD